VTVQTRLRALERATEMLRREMRDRCEVCGAYPEYGAAGHIVVLERLPPERQGTALAAAYLREQYCPECDRLVDEGGRTIHGQGESMKIVLLDSPKDPDSREELDGLDYLMPGFWERELDEDGLVNWVKVRSLVDPLLLP